MAVITKPQKRADFLRKWDDQKRSSLNDIERRARAIGGRLEGEVNDGRWYLPS
jgi:hypothetical protein